MSTGAVHFSSLCRINLFDVYQTVDVIWSITIMSGGVLFVYLSLCQVAFLFSRCSEWGLVIISGSLWESLLIQGRLHVGYWELPFTSLLLWKRSSFLDKKFLTSPFKSIFSMSVPPIKWSLSFSKSLTWTIWRTASQSSTLSRERRQLPRITKKSENQYPVLS